MGATWVRPAHRRIHATHMTVPVSTSDLWWKNAVFYCLDVETYLDSNGDGHGDFPGLTSRLDYLQRLGVTCIWLMPFYPTPNRDDGYDVADYYGVDDRLGTLGDFVVMLREAHERGMRVIVDLVVNHTSDQHPWFQEARRDPESQYRDYYVWREEPVEDENLPLMFPEAEESVWTRDGEAGQYYLHHFFSHQPDLNIANPRVWAEIERIAGFWMQLGVDGFRVDAVPLVLITGGLMGEVDLDPHDLLVDLRSFVTRRSGDCLLLGEVDVPTDEVSSYFGDGDQLNMVFNFALNQALFLALSRGDARPVVKALEALPRIPADAQWATFVRNHDELNLAQLADHERQEVFEAFGPEDEMQIFGRGLRLRLPTMLDDDEDHVRLVYSLLFTLPGSPVLLYGEEIGMGENLEIPGRLSVRTPMQWTAEDGAGFSTVEPSRFCRPLPDGRRAPERVNVADQADDPDSLLSWMREAIDVRRRTPEFGWGEAEVVGSSAPEVLAHRCEWEGNTVVAVHNLDEKSVEVDLDLGLGRGRLEAVFGGRTPVEVTDEVTNIAVEGYGYRWFRFEPF